MVVTFKGTARYFRKKQTKPKANRKKLNKIGHQPRPFITVSWFWDVAFYGALRLKVIIFSELTDLPKSAFWRKSALCSILLSATPLSCIVREINHDAFVFPV